MVKDFDILNAKYFFSEIEPKSATHPNQYELYVYIVKRSFLNRVEQFLPFVSSLDKGPFVVHDKYAFVKLVWRVENLIAKD